jgi:hypothetical protein
VAKLNRETIHFHNIVLINDTVALALWISGISLRINWGLSLPHKLRGIPVIPKFVVVFGQSTLLHPVQPPGRIFVDQYDLEYPILPVAKNERV